MWVSVKPGRGGKAGDRGVSGQGGTGGIQGNHGIFNIHLKGFSFSTGSGMNYNHDLSIRMIYQKRTYVLEMQRFF